MPLFNTQENYTTDKNQAWTCNIERMETQTSDAGKKRIQAVLPELKKDFSFFFTSNGSWSMDNIMEHVLELMKGNASVIMFSWSFGKKAAARIRNFKKKGLIRKMKLLTHPMVKSGNFSTIKMLGSETQVAYTRIHAKGFIAQNDIFKVSVISSSNYTDNQTLECGCISTIPKIYDYHKEWLRPFFETQDGEVKPC